MATNKQTEMLRLTVTLLLLPIFVRATEFIYCDEVAPIDDLRIEGCDMLPCEFPISGNFAMDIDFTANSEVTELKLLLRVKFSEEWNKVPLPSINACDYLLSGQCPMAPGDKATFQIRSPIPKILPKLSFRAELSLADQDDNPLVCFLADGKIVN